MVFDDNPITRRVCSRDPWYLIDGHYYRRTSSAWSQIILSDDNYCMAHTLPLFYRIYVVMASTKPTDNTICLFTIEDLKIMFHQ